jgi:hypothetical protein
MLLRPAAPKTVRAVLRFNPDVGPLHTVIGGWGWLVRDGTSIAAQVDSLEGTVPRFSAKRHPRTAVGVSRDSATLWLVTVDGRQTSSAGMSLVELADMMRSLGAWQALNFDGGGSSTMVVEGRLVNAPSDSAGERPSGNLLAVARRERRASCPETPTTSRAAPGSGARAARKHPPPPPAR